MSIACGLMAALLMFQSRGSSTAAYDALLEAKKGDSSDTGYACSW